MKRFKELFNRKIEERKIISSERKIPLYQLSVYGAIFPSPQMIAEGDCDGDCVNCEGMEECYKGVGNGV